MNFIKTVAVVCALLVAAPAFAQKDYNTANVSYTNTTLDPKNAESTSLNGFSVGYIHGVSLDKSHPIFLETGIKLSMGFYSDTDEHNTYTTTSSLGSLSVPLSLTYIIGVKDKFAIKPYAGIDFKVNILGKSVSESKNSKDTRNWFDKKDMNGAVCKRFQMGWHIGAAFMYDKFSLGVDYGTDFIQLAKDCTTSTLNLTFGYNF